MPHMPQNNKPDPALRQAIAKLKQTELSPLEEQLFKGWLAANGMDEKMSNSDNPTDLRKVYKQSQGQVMPVGELQKQTEKQSAIQAIMKAQEDHEKASPIKMMMDEQESETS